MLKMHRTMADVMKAMGGGKRGPMAGIANMLGLGGGMPSPEQMAKLAEKMPGGLPGLPGPAGCPASPRPAGPACQIPGFRAAPARSRRQAAGAPGLPGFGKKK